MQCECGGVRDARSALCAPCRKAQFVALCHPEERHFAKGQCERCYYRDYQRGDRERGYRLRHLYRIELGDVPSSCAICGSTAALHVDHDHACCPGRKSCGKCLRGFLCAPCNHGLGRFRDSPELLRAAALYLEEKKDASTF